MSSPASVPRRAPASELGFHAQSLQGLRSARSGLVMRGIAGALPFLHGSQGCATYMRRYIISHFREPMDIATSGFSEASTMFGGGENLRAGAGKRDLAVSSGIDRHRDDLPDRNHRRRCARAAA